jgi:hypothetical protein
MSGTRLLAAVIGLWFLMRAVNKDSTGRTLIDKIVGNKASVSPLLAMSTATGTGTGAGGAPGAAGATNPFPGGVGTWLDQGIDLTSKKFLAPVSGTVVVANQTDPGWRGGGYLAIKDSADPNRVYYMAEGISPTVRVGQQVQAGDSVAIARANPYNMVVGNIEFGRANPANPAQPLAQVISNPAAMVKNMVAWLKGLGGPTATAGHPGYA